MPSWLARKLIPRKIVPKNRPIRIRTRWALRGSGGLKAGTPFDTASVPVNATEPDEKARKDEEDAERLGLLRGEPRGGSVVLGHRPVTYRNRPNPSRPKIETR